MVSKRDRIQIYNSVFRLKSARYLLTICDNVLTLCHPWNFCFFPDFFSEWFSHPKFSKTSLPTQDNLRLYNLSIESPKTIFYHKSIIDTIYFQFILYIYIIFNVINWNEYNVYMHFVTKKLIFSKNVKGVYLPVSTPLHSDLTSTMDVTITLSLGQLLIISIDDHPHSGSIMQLAARIIWMLSHNNRCLVFSPFKQTSWPTKRFFFRFQWKQIPNLPCNTNHPFSSLPGR